MMSSSVTVTARGKIEPMANAIGTPRLALIFVGGLLLADDIVQVDPQWDQLAKNGQELTNA